MKAWFTRIRQAVTGRLIRLKHKFGKAQFQRLSALVHARFQAAKDWWKESYLIARCALLIFAIKLSMALSPEALRGYRQWLKELPGKFTRENFRKWGAAFLAWLKILPETFRGLRKSGVLASLTVFALLLFMGHSATVAWITYTTPVDRNTFQVGEMKLQVSYSADRTGNYIPMDEESVLFNDEALYEPGYTQVVYLQVENGGNMDFDYKFIVDAYKSDHGTNVYGESFDLADFLKFGLVTADSHDQLDAMVSPRGAAQALAKEYANQKLNGYTEYSAKPLTPGSKKYAALIVWMPEYVDNHANYREKAPRIELGVTVYAQQAGTMDK